MSALTVEGGKPPCLICGSASEMPCSVDVMRITRSLTAVVLFTVNAAEHPEQHQNGGVPYRVLTREQDGRTPAVTTQGRVPQTSALQGCPPPWGWPPGTAMASARRGRASPSPGCALAASAGDKAIPEGKGGEPHGANPRTPGHGLVQSCNRRVYKRGIKRRYGRVDGDREGCKNPDTNEPSDSAEVCRPPPRLEHRALWKRQR